MKDFRYFIQFSAGRGPAECEAACAAVFREFKKRYDRLAFSIIEYTDGDMCGYKSITVGLDDVDDIDMLVMMQEWEGTVKYICTRNEIRPEHKRKNWYIGVKFFEFTDNPAEFDEKDVRIERLSNRAGAGGQHLNRVESAVRLTHVPTGLQVLSVRSRDIIENRRVGMQLLKAKVAAYNEDIRKGRASDMWLGKIRLERGNEIMVLSGPLTLQY